MSDIGMDWIQKIAYSHIGYDPLLPPEESHEFIEIGEYRIADCPILVEEISNAVLKELENKRDLVQRFAPTQLHRLPRSFLSPLDFIYPLEDGQNSKRERATPLLDNKRNLPSFLAYLERIFPDLARFFFTRLQFRIPEEARRKHSYLIGGSGSGKSELMKVMMYPYIKPKKRKATVILFDPHGDVAEQVARWKQHEGGE